MPASTFPNVLAVYLFSFKFSTLLDIFSYSLVVAWFWLDYGFTPFLAGMNDLSKWLVNSNIRFFIMPNTK